MKFKNFIVISCVLMISSILLASPNLGMPFVKNKGQIKDKNVAYHAKTFSGGFFILKNGTIIHSLSNNKIEIDNTTTLFETFNNIKKLNFTEQDRSNLKVNFFYGKKKEWFTNLNTYKIINYGNIYNGIDLKLLSRDNNIEKLFVVEPFANPKEIDITLKGATNLRKNFDGRLLATTDLGDISFTKPVAWTEDGDKVKFVDISYKITKNGYGFKLGEYDRANTLVIDPLLGSTFIGGSNADEILDMDINRSNSVYVVGHTLSSIHTTLSLTPGRTYTAKKDGFIVMLNEDLNSSSYMTYIGGSENDEIKAIDINSSGSIYITGITESSNFPTTTDGNDTSFNGDIDGFVLKLNSTLSTIGYSTYIGGSGNDILTDIAIDNNGYIFTTGYTMSSESTLPVRTGEGNDSTQNGNYDSVTFKLDSNLSTIINSTFLGTSVSDGSRVVEINGSNIYVAGFTSSSTFPVSNTSGKGIDSFIVQFDTNLTDANLSLISGNGDDELYGLDFNYSSGLVVVGSTTSTDLSGAGTSAGNKDGFLASFLFNLSGNSKQISYLGGSDNDEIRAIAIDTDKNTTFVTGYTTSSSDFNTTNSIYQTTNKGNGDVFISKYKNGIKDLNSSTFIGGSQLDLAHSIKIGNDENIFISGITLSSDFPTSNITGNILASYSGDSDGFIFKIDENLSNDYSIINTSATSTNKELITNSQYLHFKNVINEEKSDEIIVTITNSGTSTLSISSMDFNNTSYGYELQERSSDSSYCKTTQAFTILAKKSCTFGLTFTPSQLNDANVTLTINNDSNQTEHNITIAGIGVLEGVQNILVTPTILDFQNIKTVALNNYLDLNLTIMNKGASNLVISDINSSDGNFTIDTNSTGYTCLNTTPTISNDSNCTLGVRFTPTVVGDFNQTLSIKSNDPDTPIKTVKLNARAVSGISGSPISKNYGNIATDKTSDFNITISNTGASNVSVTAITIHTGTSYSIVSTFGDCSALPATLSQNEDCNITVRLSPATTGNLTDILKITSDDSAYPEFNISLSGTGVSPSSGHIDTNVTVRNFETTNIGVTSTYDDIKLSNSGLADVIVSGMSVNGSTVFTVDTTKGSKPCNSTTPTISAGGYCTIGINFTPANSTNYEHNLTISSNAGNGDLNISMVGSGVLNNGTGLSLSYFNVSKASGISPLTTTFAATAIGGSSNYNYLWNFGDSTTSTTQNPSHTFSTVGDYNVSVKITDGSNSNLYIMTDTNISVVSSYLPLVVSSLSISPSAGAIPLATKFSITPSGGSGGYSYIWNFGDGTTSTDQNPSHTYTATGSYSVSVTTTDSVKNTTIGTATVTALDTSTLSISMSGTPTSGTPPLDVTFTGTVTGGSTPYTLNWNFGDGDTTTQTIYTTAFTKSHTFSKSGSFETQLSVSDGNNSGTSNTRISSIMGITANSPISSKSTVDPTGGDGDYCFIATAAYGSLLEPEVKVLREFRDKYLRSTKQGRWFIATYYRLSPPIANYISKNEILKSIVRVILTPIIYSIKYKTETLILILLSLILLIVGKIRVNGYNPKEILKIKAN